MNPSQPNSRECAQRAIDAEIKSLKLEESTREYIRTLKLRRNEISPISSLTPEFFAAIFTSLCLPASGTSPPGRKLDHRARLRVTRVCHQWRKIALNLPLLWSHIDCTTVNLAGLTEIIARAGTLPLYLKARVPANYWDGPRFSAFQEELQARISRICHLAIGAEPFHLLNTLEGLVSPAPTLEYLSLSSKFDWDGTQTMEDLIPDTLFSGTTPRLFCLKLRNCNISWRSPLLKGLKHLEIVAPHIVARPKVADWLDALDEMPQLQTLTLHEASPIASSSHYYKFPFGVERTVTLPSLTHINISANPGDCGLALIHLVLPALTWLCLTVRTEVRVGGDMHNLLPYIARHAHGPQDTRPLQSALIRGNSRHVDIFAWPVPDIEMDDPPVSLDTIRSTRVALSLAAGYDIYSGLDAVMEVLSLDNLVTLTAQQEVFSRSDYKQFWDRHSPMWPLLWRVQLAPSGECVFAEMLLEDDGGRESPLLPSLTVLVLAGRPDSTTLHLLCDALMKRVEQGVPLETLDLRMCDVDCGSPAQFRLLGEIVVNVLGPESAEAKKMSPMWDVVGRAFIDEGDNSGEDDDDDDDDDEYMDDEEED